MAMVDELASFVVDVIINPIGLEKPMFEAADP